MVTKTDNHTSSPTQDEPNLPASQTPPTDQKVQTVVKQTPLESQEIRVRDVSCCSRIWKHIKSGFNWLIQKIGALFRFIFCCGSKRSKIESKKTCCEVNKVLEDVQFYFTKLDDDLNQIDFKKGNVLNDLLAYDFEIREGPELCKDLKKVILNEKQSKVTNSLNERFDEFKDKLNKKIKTNWSNILSEFNKEWKSLNKDGTPKVSRYRLRKFCKCGMYLKERAKELKLTFSDVSLLENVEGELKKRPNNIATGIPGISNIGNSCYMNASLQALLAIPEVKTKIKERLEQETDKERKDILEALDSFIEMLKTYDEEKIAQAAWMLRHKIFYSELFPDFIGGLTSQKDAPSFVQAVLDVIGWDPIRFRFDRRGVGQFKDMQREGNKEEEFMIKVTLSSDKKKNLQDLIHDEYQEKKNENSWKYDSKLTLKSFVEQKEHIGSPPKYVFLQLKRFNKKYEKIKDKIKFPEGGVIDLSGPFKSEAKYRMICCVNHHGSSLSGGHYTSYLKKGDQWYHCDDRYVSTVTKKKVPKEEAYIVILEKI